MHVTYKYIIYIVFFYLLTYIFSCMSFINIYIKQVFKLKNDNERDVEGIENEDKMISSREKLDMVSSPFKMKKKLNDSPSRIFDKLDINSFYNHPKYSVTFQLITEAIVEMTEPANMTDFVKNIVENLLSASKTENRKRRSSLPQNSGTHDINALFNDIFFLQSNI